ncbi:MAG: glycoside hydrolase family 127 protein [Candidatus Sumerlaeota bacterium]|nr:glycoside hydrolase family 127 protein [Candidatus Sumerlaeota bacterium]
MRILVQVVAVTLLSAVALGETGQGNQKSAWKAPAWTPVEQVRLLGVYGGRLQRACERLRARPFDELGYVLADVSLDRKRIFTEYSGDISGRMIGVYAYLSHFSPADATRLKEFIAGLPAWQKPDGHFGAVQNLPELNRKKDMPILWGNGRLLIGLMEAYEETHNSVALDAARKLGDYFVATDGVYCKAENLKSVGGEGADAYATCYFSCIEGLVALARETKDARYLKEARRISDLALTVTQFEKFHSHGRLSCVRGFLDLYDLTGDRSYLDGAERDWRTVFDLYRLPTGGISEYFKREDQRDEGCSVSDWLRLNLALWRATGKGLYLDEAERCLKNHFLYQQFAAGGAGHRVMKIIGGEPAAFRSGGTDAYWCCCEHWPRALIDAARLGLTATGDGVSLNLLMDMEVTLQAAGTQWQIRCEEVPGGVRVRLKPEKTVSAALRIHRPAWANDVMIDAPKGIVTRTGADEVVISGQWESAGQTIEARFPRQIRMERTPGGGAILLAGYDLLTAHATPANAWLFENDPKSRPLIAWSEAGKEKDRKKAKEDSKLDGAAMRIPAALVDGATSRATSWRMLDLTPMRQTDGAFPHRCWFEFDLPATGADLNAARNEAALAAVDTPSDNSKIYLVAAATVPCRVVLNGQEVARIKGAEAPLDGFFTANAIGPPTLLLICEPDAKSALPPAVIAQVSGAAKTREGKESPWRVRALTSKESAQSPEAYLADKNWQPAAPLDPARIPSRENRASPLEDLSAPWITGNTDKDHPALAFFYSW